MSDINSCARVEKRVSLNVQVVITGSLHESLTNVDCVFCGWSLDGGAHGQLETEILNIHKLLNPRLNIALNPIDYGFLISKSLLATHIQE